MVLVCKALITSSAGAGPTTALSTNATISNCYDGDTCYSKTGEKIILACINAPKIAGEDADPVSAKAAKDFLNQQIAGKTVSIKRIIQDVYGRTVADLSVDGVNIQKLLVDNGHAKVNKYFYQCDWSFQNFVNIRYCYDGDTCSSKTGERIRLPCIDAPEMAGEDANPVPAKAARDFLNQQIAGKTVSIKRFKKDIYGRTVADLSVDGVNIQKLLVDNGHAKIKQYDVGGTSECEVFNL